MDFSTIITLFLLLICVMSFVLTPISIGKIYGSKQIIKHPELIKAPVGTVISTAFGLLAFIMAFTFQIASSRFDARKKLLLDEVTIIRTTNLKADFLPSTYRMQSKELLLKYVTLQVKLPHDVSKLEQAINESNIILDSLWRISRKVAVDKEFTSLHNSYITSLSSLLEIHNQRLTIAIEYRIPYLILIILGLIIFCAMFALGFYFGISSKNYFRITLIYSIIFSLVIVLILILDHPELGLSNVNQQPIRLLQMEMKEQITKW